MKIKLAYVFALLPMTYRAQGKLEIYEGNKAYAKSEFQQADNAYGNAITQSPENFDALFNSGNANYKLEDLETAKSRYKQALNHTDDHLKKSRAFHNLGNAHLQSGEIDAAIESYKDALRLNPNDDDTRHNLAYAQRLKKQQENKKQQDQQNKEEQNKDNQQDQEGSGNESQNKQEQDKKNETKKDQQQNSKKEDIENNENEKPENSDQQKQSKENGEQGKPGEQKPLRLSPEQIQQMLEAVKNQDQQLQNQIKQSKVSEKPKTDKDW